MWHTVRLRTSRSSISIAPRNSAMDTKEARGNFSGARLARRDAARGLSVTVVLFLFIHLFFALFLLIYIRPSPILFASLLPSPILIIQYPWRVAAQFLP
ncbi:hypothetical protein BOTBODRAFT_300887 [Botryobasidium botryosum FD-172 SS1]|uniref:Uncharacterized protein n=1 Tax=Botryobasidium botryosum (strain FD-172 SS1) TaxID=930990 RepID=A0A067MGW6_BOTB1|nr:hypothetical protein BOTBODRAFT_300887 [Botryobasidium botryosum FD-172 SS1]